MADVDSFISRWQKAVRLKTGRAITIQYASKPSPVPLADRLVALNRERAAAETAGHIRYLRPDYQAPVAAPHPVGASSISSIPSIQSIQSIPPAAAIPALSARLAGRSTSKRRAQLQAILETLQSLGHA